MIICSKTRASEPSEVTNCEQMILFYRKWAEKPTKGFKLKKKDVENILDYEF